MNIRTVLILAIGIAALFPVVGFADNGADDLWEVTANITMDGMRLPGAPSRVCTKGNQADRMMPMEKDCKTSDVKTSGNRTTFRVVCTGKDPMSGTGDMTTGKGSYRGVLSLSGIVDGEKSTMVAEYSGKLVGKCTAK
jgi:hypothetical protein